jgi:hypothetical protein
MIKTGIFATIEEATEIREAFNFPVMYLSGGLRMGENPRDVLHKIALSHGLPEIQGYYGLDEDNEFVKVD